MVHRAEFKVLGQLKADPEQVFTGDGRGRAGVADMGNTVSEGKSRRSKDKQVAERGAAEGLRLHIPAEHVSGEIGTRTVRFTAASEIGLVGGRRVFQSSVATQPIVRKQYPIRARRSRLGVLLPKSRTARDDQKCGERNVKPLQY